MQDTDALEQTLIEIYDSLTDNQKARVKECKTSEELLAFAAQESIELPDKVLEAVAGGLLFEDTDLYGKTRYRVFNDKTGMPMSDWTYSEAEARQKAAKLGQSTQWIDYGKLATMQRKSRVY